MCFLAWFVKSRCLYIFLTKCRGRCFMFVCFWLIQKVVELIYKMVSCKVFITWICNDYMYTYCTDESDHSKDTISKKKFIGRCMVSFSDTLPTWQSVLLFILETACVAWNIEEETWILLMVVVVVVWSNRALKFSPQLEQVKI